MGVPAGRKAIGKVKYRDRITWIEQHRHWIVELLSVLRHCRLCIVIPLQNTDIRIIGRAASIDVHIANAAPVDASPQIDFVNGEQPPAVVRP